MQADVEVDVQQCLPFGISASGSATGTIYCDGVDDSVIRASSETDETGAIERAERNDIVERVGEAKQGVQSINRATDEQSTSTEDVAQMIDDVIESSEATDAEVDTVAAAEEQTESIVRISDGAAELTDTPDALKTEFETFE